MSAWTIMPASTTTRYNRLITNHRLAIFDRIMTPFENGAASR